MQFLVVLLVIFVVGVIAYAIYASARRRKELSAWALARGLRFDPSKDRGMDNRFGEFKSLHQGHSRYAYNVAQGQLSGLEICAFDYHYATGSGKNRSDHHFSALVATSRIPLKPLRIRPEGFFDKVAEFFGFDDIDFESAEFSRKFHVSAPDKRWAYDVIHQRMMEYLLSAGEFSVEFNGGHVIAWRSKRFRPHEFENAADFIRGILDRLPEYLVRQQGQGP